MLQTERALRTSEQQRSIKREKELRAQMDVMREVLTNQETIKCKALERERDAALSEVENLKLQMAKFQEIGDMHSTEKVEKEQLQIERDELQKQVEQLKLQLHQEKEMHAERQQRNAEREEVLLRQIRELKEQIRTVEDKCTDAFVPKLKVLQRENALLKAICVHINDYSMDNTQNNEAMTSVRTDDEENLNARDSTENQCDAEDAVTSKEEQDEDIYSEHSDLPIVTQVTDFPESTDNGVSSNEQEDLEMSAPHEHLDLQDLETVHITENQRDDNLNEITPEEQNNPELNILNECSDLTGEVSSTISEDAHDTSDREVWSEVTYNSYNEREESDGVSDTEEDQESDEEGRSSQETENRRTGWRRLICFMKPWNCRKK